MSGYDLEKRFSRSIGHFWSAKISQIYRDLHTMENSCWVKSEKILQTDRPNKKIFEITDAGKAELENWLADLEIKSDFDIRLSFLMRMYFASKMPANKTIELLELIRKNCCIAIDSLTAANIELERYDLEEVFFIKTTVAYGEKYYKMQIEWCDETIEKIHKRSSGQDE
jgi:DNA-binding PadR family transcriptional regulator